MRKRISKPQQDATVPMINIVFLMLIFFVVTGTVSKPIDRDLKLIKLDEKQVLPPQGAVLLKADRSILYEGERFDDISQLLSKLQDKKDIRLLVDCDLEASKLIEISQVLQEDGAERIFIIGERKVKHVSP